MRALHVPAAGEPPRLAELPVPAPGEGQVLVRVQAAGLNAIDTSIASGTMAQMMPHAYPLILGRDAAGVVEAVGPGVDDLAPGQEVFGHVLLAPPIQAGTLADDALLPAAAVSPRPAGLDVVTAAALPLAGAAASAAVDAVKPQPRETVLVVGASGGVGSFAVQMLASRGVTVLATGTAADTERLTGLGAATVIDYTTAPVVDQIRAAYPDGIDALIDLVARSTDQLPLSVLRSGGRVASSLGAVNDDALGAAGLTGTNIMARPTREVLSALAEQALAGTLTVDIDTIVPLEQAADGLNTLANRHTSGKIVVKVSD
ncbi:NADP-dependent oxidoreductase [Micromonospora sp. NPDC051296]|uniref:NADP-dependent oxidoreductase n=1 Tax=Micromonospora sp. NPDC051296 TaxID=3155046 RepID=UPI0034320550